MWMNVRTGEKKWPSKRFLNWMTLKLIPNRTHDESKVLLVTIAHAASCNSSEALALNAWWPCMPSRLFETFETVDIPNPLIYVLRIVGTYWSIVLCPSQTLPVRSRTLAHRQSPRSITNPGLLLSLQLSILSFPSLGQAVSGITQSSPPLSCCAVPSLWAWAGPLIWV